MEKTLAPVVEKWGKDINDNVRITTILVDTCAFQHANSDFIGIYSKLLPSFYAAIDEKKMLLLTHPILEKEIEKHIEDSGLCKNYQDLLYYINKCSNVLKHANCSDKQLFAKISKYDIKHQTFKAFKEYYKNAVSLNYPDPELIFNLYFSAKPPFSEVGKKKNEFPDAFVIEATKQYIEEHPNDVLLVVSKDRDWNDSFVDLDEVIMCESIDEAVTKINSIESILSEEMLSEIFRGAYDDILSEAEDCAMRECYELDDYEFIEDLEVDSLETQEVEDIFVPLKISRDMMLIKTVVSIKVSGHGAVFDEERSIWDSEDKEYMVRMYSDIEFTDGYAEIECEIRIIFDFDDLEHSAQVDSFKLNNIGNIRISSDNIKIVPIDEDEMAMRYI